MNFREGDWDYLTQVFQPKGVPTSNIVRKLVSDFVDRIRARETPIPLNLFEE